MLTRDEINHVAAVAVLSTADVFLGPRAVDAIVAGMERRARPRSRGLGALGTKPVPSFTEQQTAEYLANTSPIDPDVNALLKATALAEGLATEETWKDIRVPNVTPAVLDWVGQQMQNMAMVGIQVPFNPSYIESTLGHSGMDLIFELFGKEALHAPRVGTDMAEQVARMLKIPWDLVDAYLEVARQRQEARTPAGGIIGKTVTALAPIMLNSKLWLAISLAVITWGLAAPAIGGGAAAGGGGAATTTEAATAATGATATAGATVAPLTAAHAAAMETALAPIVAPAAAISATTATTTGAGIIGILDNVKKAAPKVVDAVNTANTIKAVAKGEVPPPPIDIGSGSMTDWATAIGEQLISGKMTDLEKQQLESQIRLLQQQAAPYASGGYQPSSAVPPEIQQAMQAESERQGTKDMLLWIALPLLAVAVIFGGQQRGQSYD